MAGNPVLSCCSGLAGTSAALAPCCKAIRSSATTSMYSGGNPVLEKRCGTFSSVRLTRKPRYSISSGGGFVPAPGEHVLPAVLSFWRRWLSSILSRTSDGGCYVPNCLNFWSSSYDLLVGAATVGSPISLVFWRE